MNKNMKYWAAGIIGAVVIIAIAAFAAAGNRKQPLPTPPETESSTPSTKEAATTSASESDMDHSSHMKNDAASDDNTIRYLHRQDEIMMEMMHDMENIPKTGNASIDFLNGMIPHHESAIAMADSYLEYGGENETLKKLAENIKTTQTEEISHMRDLIVKYEAEGHTDEDQESAYLDEYDKLMQHDHSMSKSGTDSLDHAFAEGMIMHHQMAVDMAKSILEYTDYEEIRTLAQDIIEAQEQEIEEMKEFTS